LILHKDIGVFDGLWYRPISARAQPQFRYCLHFPRVTAMALRAKSCIQTILLYYGWWRTVMYRDKLRYLTQMWPET